MGRAFQFECPQCQYRATVSGGADRGVNCAVQTIVCHDCHLLFDALTRVLRRADEVGSAPVQGKPVRALPPDGITIPPLRLVENPWSVFPPLPRPSSPPVRWLWAEVKPACPADDVHRIEFWNEPGRCPRCGNYLEKKSAFPWRLWD